MASLGDLEILGAAALGGGSAVRMKVEPAREAGLATSDTVVAGPLLGGLGVGLAYNFTDHLLAMAEARALGAGWKMGVLGRDQRRLPARDFERRTAARPTFRPAIWPCSGTPAARCAITRRSRRWRWWAPGLPPQAGRRPGAAGRHLQLVVQVAGPWPPAPAAALRGQLDALRARHGRRPDPRAAGVAVRAAAAAGQRRCPPRPGVRRRRRAGAAGHFAPGVPGRQRLHRRGDRPQDGPAGAGPARARAAAHHASRRWPTAITARRWARSRSAIWASTAIPSGRSPSRWSASRPLPYRAGPADPRWLDPEPEWSQLAGAAGAAGLHPGRDRLRAGAAGRGGHAAVQPGAARAPAPPGPARTASTSSPTRSPPAWAGWAPCWPLTSPAERPRNPARRAARFRRSVQGPHRRVRCRCPRC